MKVFVAVLALVACTYGARTNNVGWRIVGGDVAADGQFPYQVSLRYNGSHSCGGSILDETTILCAAHCVDGRSASRMTIVAGSNKLNSGGDVYEVEKNIVHPSFNPWAITNDIALIKLKSSIKLNDKVQPVQLREDNIDGVEDCILSGWGTTTFPGNLPNDLQFIHLKTQTYEDCQAAHSDLLIFDSDLCTLTKSGEGACQGDSGGPLVDANGYQIGIVSWGVPCARGKPDVFTRVHYFKDWIAENRN